MKLTSAQKEMFGRVPSTWGDVFISFTNNTLNALKRRGLVQVRRNPGDPRTFSFNIQWRLAPAGLHLHKYNVWIVKVRKGSAKLVVYTCPTCREKIEALVPPKGDQYDSLVECPYCGEMHFKVVDADGHVNVKKMVYVERARQVGRTHATHAREAGRHG